MTRGIGQRTGLAPAGHPAIDQPRIDGHAIVRPQAQLFHHAGAEPFEHSIGLRDQLEKNSAIPRRFQVERNRPFAATKAV